MMKPTDPVTIRLSYEWTFDPADSLPEDYDEWTREQVVDWFKDDIAENLHEYADLDRIRQHLHEALDGPPPLTAAAPDLLSALEELVAFDVAKNMNKARAAIAKAKGETQ